MADGDKPFEGVVTIPKLIIKAKYTSSGVLIIIPASGGGEFHAVMGNKKFRKIKKIVYTLKFIIEGVTADIKGKISTFNKNDIQYLRVDSLFLDLSVKTPKLRVAKIFNNNKILSKFSEQKK